MSRLMFLLVLGALLASCSSPGSRHQVREGNHYAGGFQIQQEEDFDLVTVVDPWQNSRDNQFKFILTEEGQKLPDSLSGLQVLHPPLQRIICMSTSHLAFLEALGRAGTVVGASGTSFIYSPFYRKAVEQGRISELGYESSLDYERILKLRPDLVILYGVEGQVMGVREKLQQMGIASLICGEYLETHPLGKAEWVRLFGALTGTGDRADSLFTHVDSAYTAIRELTDTLRHRPEVLSGLPWKDVWYMAGGRSHIARLISDAGGSYLWQDSPSEETLPLNLETVYQRATGADIWINPGVARSLQEILDHDPRFSHLAVMNEGQVFNNNVRLGEGGGNDYWESGVLRPDLVLADLLAAFHPELCPDHSYTYYRQLK